MAHRSVQAGFALRRSSVAAARIHFGRVVGLAIGCHLSSAATGEGLTIRTSGSLLPDASDPFVPPRVVNQTMTLRPLELALQRPFLLSLLSICARKMREVCRKIAISVERHFFAVFTVWDEARLGVRSDR